jgi:probable HAF family extracellular repeat protein
MLIRNFAAPGHGPGRFGRCSAVAVAVALACAQGPAPAASITGMGTMPFADLTITSLSDDGVAYGLASAMVGAGDPGLFLWNAPTSYRRAYTWSAASPSLTSYISTVDNGRNGGIAAIAANGFAAGWSLEAGSVQAAVWGSAGPTMINAMPNGSFATAISADGARAAGVRDTFSGPFVTGSSATFPSGNGFSFLPSGLSGNGQAVVGSSSIFSGLGSFSGYVASNAGGSPHWLSITEIFPGFPSVDAGPGSSAVAITNPSFNATGSDYSLTAVGNGLNQGAAQAFVFEKTLGGLPTLSYLGTLAGDQSSRAAAMVADGSLVIGKSTAAGGVSRPFLWAPGSGMQDLGAWLGGQGANLTSWQLQSATAVSANGNYMSGLGLHNGQQEAWFVDLAAVDPRVLHSTPGSVVDFNDATSWLGASGNPATTAPGRLDDVVLRPGQLYQLVSIRVGAPSVVRSAELVDGIFTIDAGALKVEDTLTVHGASLAVVRQAAVSAKALVVGRVGDNGGLLEIGANSASNGGASLVVETADVQDRGRVTQWDTTTVKVAKTLTVHGEYFAYERQDFSQLAVLEAGRIEVLTTCTPPNPCRTGSFTSGGAVRAGSIRNAGQFTWRGESMVVGSGTPANDPLDAFLNEGTLSVYANSKLANSPGSASWTGNVTNALGATIKTYGVTKGNITTKVDWGTGTFTNNGVYKSDPAVNVFGTLVVGDEGYLTGGEGDAFQVRGDFTSTSHSTQWDVQHATLSFLGAGQHTYSVSSSTSWGTLQLDPDVQLSLKAVGDGPVSFSFASLSGFSSLADLQQRFSADSGITIQVASVEGGWADAGTITLSGGGTLITAVPEPSAQWMALAGLLGLGLARRRSSARSL